MTDRPRSSTEGLIADLAGDLGPVRRWQRPRFLLGGWLLVALLIVVAMSLAYAPWRPGVADQLLSVPRFALEIALGAAGFCLLSWVAVQSAVPGALPRGQIPFLFLLAGAPWLGLLCLGLIDPALAPSMAGKRAYCHLEVMVESLPPLALGLLVLRHLYPLRGWRSGALLGFASGMLPALLMQLSCMYLVDHAFSHHVLPVLVPGLLGALAGGALLRR